MHHLLTFSNPFGSMVLKEHRNSQHLTMAFKQFACRDMTHKARYSQLRQQLLSQQRAAKCLLVKAIKRSDWWLQVKEELVTSWARYLGQHTLGGDAARRPPGTATNQWSSRCILDWFISPCGYISPKARCSLEEENDAWGTATQKLSCGFFLKNRN